MRRGEVTGTVASRSSSEEFVRNGYGRYIAQIGGRDKDVPQLARFAETAEAKSLVALIQSQGDISRLTAGPPGIPAGQLEALRTAYRTAMEDKELQDKAQKGGRPLDPANGAEVETMVTAALDQTPQIVALLSAALSEKPPMLKIAGALLDVQNKGREIVMQGADGKPMTLEPSGSRTKITIAGKDAKRDELKTGQACEITYAAGSNEPSAIACQ